MPRQPRLSDLQLILLSSAAMRDNCAVLPLPHPVQDDERTRRELRTLLRRGFIAAATTGATPAAWEIAGDAHVITKRDVVSEAMAATANGPAFTTMLVLTDSGRAAIGLEPNEQLIDDAQEPGPQASEACAVPPDQPRSGSKAATVLDLLRRLEGASLADLTAATGWQPHSARAVLTGLRKQGHAIDKSKHGGVTRYSISGEAK